MPTLWLPPKVWFQGSQSTSTGGSSASDGKHWRIICWLAHSMRWVLITPLGSLVEPEVKRNLAIVSGPTWRVRGVDRGGRRRRAAGRRTASVGAAVERAVGQHDRRRRAAPTAAIALRVRRRRWRRTPGPASACRGCGAACRSPARRSEYAGEIGAYGTPASIAPRPSSEMLDVVVGQDRERPLGARAAVEQRLRDRARAAPAPRRS